MRAAVSERASPDVRRRTRSPRPRWAPRDGCPGSTRRIRPHPSTPCARADTRSRPSRPAFMRSICSTGSRAFPVCLLFGHEVDGLQPELLELCDTHVRIPMLGRKHSLNVATAGGVVIYELLRKYRRMMDECRGYDETATGLSRGCWRCLACWPWRSVRAGSADDVSAGSRHCTRWWAPPTTSKSKPASACSTQGGNAVDAGVATCWRPPLPSRAALGWAAKCPC